MVFLPEMAPLLDSDQTRAAPHIVPEAESAMVARLCQIAREAGVWLHTGSTPLRAQDGSGRAVNRSHIIDASGTIVARYDKIHLFDVTLPTGETWRESATYAPGQRLSVVDTPVGRLGLAICFDMRFPEQFAALRAMGAEVLAVPAAFTVPTGQAHWHTLLRARAIETACFVLAPAQVGQHADGRATFGHSLAVDPWGVVLADAGNAGPTEQVVMLDRAALDRARDAIPLDHVALNPI